jgi:hypothetical protein
MPLHVSSITCLSSGGAVQTTLGILLGMEFHSKPGVVGVTCSRWAQDSVSDKGTGHSIARRNSSCDLIFTYDASFPFEIHSQLSRDM